MTTLPKPPEPPLLSSIEPSPGGGFHISFEGVLGAVYRLDESTNLLNWGAVGTVSNESGLVEFLNGFQNNHPNQFYRAVRVQ